ncbi:hypothetical protein BZG02_10815 [Labilibaculum filiforme]|uniref:Uncharacterized protein n=1 Tax=Labilibaculum filiforme TaxID=1940526 RepID=A0A2N3HYT5_9BACT|nr:hypothetical protein [Labilibaculum filiforme]PKQ63230.1 hypothetical protein BZG02_10815 [Labilibaculum filiforme]
MNNKITDEIDFKVVDQLHAATLNFSNTSIELKKMYVIIIGIAVPALLILNKQNLDTSIFVVLYLLSVIFWLVDSFTYHHQVKLRLIGNKKLNEIYNRNNYNFNKTKPKNFIIDPFRKNEIINALCNSSHILYYLCFLVNSIGFILYKFDFIT